MKKNIPIWLLLAVCALTAPANKSFGQQIAPFTQNQFAALFNNPAYTGSKAGIHLESLFRFQWLGIKGLPLTQAIGLHLQSPNLRGGLGLQITNDMLGAERNTALYLSYAYRIKVRQKIFSAGIQIGATQKALRGDLLQTPTGNYTDGTIDHNDNILPLNTQGGLMPDMSIGLLMQTPKLVLGLTLKQGLGIPLNIDGTAQKIKFYPVRHVLLNTEYKITTFAAIDLIPVLLLKTDLNKIQIDAGMRIEWDNRLGLGVSLRGAEGSMESLGLMASAKLNNKWHIGYAYDLPLSLLKGASSGSHEIGFQYFWNVSTKIKGGKTIYNPRFL